MAISSSWQVFPPIYGHLALTSLMRCESGGTRQQIYRTTSHTKYDLKYHLVWITKYPRAALGGVVGTRVRELVREICRADEIDQSEVADGVRAPASVILGQTFVGREYFAASSGNVTD